MRGLSPTAEQERAVEAFLRGANLRIVAVAGSGKTTTLALMAQARPGERFLYLSFNRALRLEAGRKMPPNVESLTLHALAYRELVRPNPLLEAKLRRGDGTVRAYQVMEALGEASWLEAYVVKETLENFLRSPEEEPLPSMIPLSYRRLIQRKGRPEEVEAILEGVRRLWRRIQDPQDPFPLSHDAYVKLWAAQGPRIGGVEALLVDEAQDLDPVLAGVLEAQGVQRVYVGDPNQQIYAWRGAVDALSRLEGEELTLSQSFRFSEELAAGVRELMRSFGRELPLYGRASHRSRVGEVRGKAFTVLARSNAGLVEALVELDPPRAHVVGGVENLIWLLQDAEALRRGGERERPHPDLVLARSWADLERLAEEVGEASAGVLLRLAERFGDLRALAQALAERWTPRERGGVVLSTAHRAKGKEWDQVLLWRDFPQVWREEERERYLGEEGGHLALREEENLLYVATTRARRLLALPPELALFWEWASPPSPGEELALLRQRVEELQGRLEALEREVRALRRQAARPVARPAPPGEALDPRLAEAYAGRAFIHLRKGEVEEAQRDLRRFLELAPQHPDAPRIRALLRRLGEG